MDCNIGDQRAWTLEVPACLGFSSYMDTEPAFSLPATSCDVLADCSDILGHKILKVIQGLTSMRIRFRRWKSGLGSSSSSSSSSSSGQTPGIEQETGAVLDLPPSYSVALTMCKPNTLKNDLDVKSLSNDFKTRSQHNHKSWMSNNDDIPPPPYYSSGSWKKQKKAKIESGRFDWDASNRMTDNFADCQQRPPSYENSVRIDATSLSRTKTTASIIV